MSFRALLARLGAEALARRLGVTAATIKRWSRQGLSGVGRGLLAELRERVRQREHARAQAEQRRAEREERYRRAAEKAKRTRRRKQRFKDRLVTPPLSELPREDVLPDSPPVPGGAAEGELRYRRIGTRNFDTNRYEGTTTTLHVGQPAYQVDWAALSRLVAGIWRESRRLFGRAIFLLFRYIPFNPLYRGPLVHNQGSWIDFWVSTPVENAYHKLVDGVMTVMDDLIDQPKGMLVRMLWLEQVQVQCFDYREEPPNTRRVMSTVVS